MLIIRKEQMEVFQKASAAHFPVRAAKHLKKRFPQECAALGDAGLTGFIEKGIERASGQGLVTQNGARLFLELLLELGWNFNSDPQAAWAVSILEDPELKEEPAAIAKLSLGDLAYQEKVLGPDRKFRLEACKRFLAEPLEAFPSGAWFDAPARERLAKIWPQKNEFLGDEKVGALIGLASKVAGPYGLGTSPGPFVVLGLMYILGSGFDQDPVYAWAREILEEKADKDPNGRLKPLLERFRAAVLPA